LKDFAFGLVLVCVGLEIDVVLLEVGLLAFESAHFEAQLVDFGLEAIPFIFDVAQLLVLGFQHFGQLAQLVGAVAAESAVSGIVFLLQQFDFDLEPIPFCLLFLLLVLQLLLQPLAL
jgi:hypothetical protein